MYTKKSPLTVNTDLKRLAKHTQNYSGRELKDKLIKGAIHLAILREKQKIGSGLFEEILKRIDHEKTTHKNRMLYG
jgi:AAA family ATPase